METYILDIFNSVYMSEYCTSVVPILAGYCVLYTSYRTVGYCYFLSFRTQPVVDLGSFCRSSVSLVLPVYGSAEHSAPQGLKLCFEANVISGNFCQTPVQAGYIQLVFDQTLAQSALSCD